MKTARQVAWLLAYFLCCGVTVTAGQQLIAAGLGDGPATVIGLCVLLVAGWYADEAVALVRADLAKVRQLLRGQS